MSRKNSAKRWDEWAEKNPFFFIDTECSDESSFWEKGKDDVEKFILPLLKKYAIPRKLAVDFGCGLGRHSQALSSHFHQVIGVDSSKKMLRKALQKRAEAPATKLIFLTNSHFFEKKWQTDFLYSARVFQHIEDPQILWETLEKLLKNVKGYAYLHFDTRKQDALYRLKRLLPDFLLPKTHQRGIRRTRQVAEEIRIFFEKNGFEVLEEHGPKTAHHFFLIRKSPLTSVPLSIKKSAQQK